MSRQLLETSVDGILIIEADGTIAMVNRELEKQFGTFAMNWWDSALKCWSPKRPVLPTSISGIAISATRRPD